MPNDMIVLLSPCLSSPEVSQRKIFPSPSQRVVGFSDMIGKPSTYTQELRLTIVHVYSSRRYKIQ